MRFSVFFFSFFFYIIFPANIPQVIKWPEKTAATRGKSQLSDLLVTSSSTGFFPPDVHFVCHCQPRPVSHFLRVCKSACATIAETEINGPSPALVTRVCVRHQMLGPEVQTLGPNWLVPSLAQASYRRTLKQIWHGN